MFSHFRFLSLVIILLLLLIFFLSFFIISLLLLLPYALRYCLCDAICHYADYCLRHYAIILRYAFIHYVPLFAIDIDYVFSLLLLFFDFSLLSFAFFLLHFAILLLLRHFHTILLLSASYYFAFDYDISRYYILCFLLTPDALLRFRCAICIFFHIDYMRDTCQRYYILMLRLRISLRYFRRLCYDYWLLPLRHWYYYIILADIFFLSPWCHTLNTYCRAYDIFMIFFSFSPPLLSHIHATIRRHYITPYTPRYFQSWYWVLRFSSFIFAIDISFLSYVYFSDIIMPLFHCFHTRFLSSIHYVIFAARHYVIIIILFFSPFSMAIFSLMPFIIALLFHYFCHFRLLLILRCHDIIMT